MGADALELGGRVGDQVFVADLDVVGRQVCWAEPGNVGGLGGPIGQVIRPGPWLKVRPVGRVGLDELVVAGRNIAAVADEVDGRGGGKKGGDLEEAADMGR